MRKLLAIMFLGIALTAEAQVSTNTILPWFKTNRTQGVGYLWWTNRANMYSGTGTFDYITINGTNVETMIAGAGISEANARGYIHQSNSPLWAAHGSNQTAIGNLSTTGAAHRVMLDAAASTNAANTLAISYAITTNAAQDTAIAAAIATNGYLNVRMTAAESTNATAIASTYANMTTGATLTVRATAAEDTNAANTASSLANMQTGAVLTTRATAAESTNAANTLAISFAVTTNGQQDIAIAAAIATNGYLNVRMAAAESTNAANTASSLANMQTNALDNTAIGNLATTSAAHRVMIDAAAATNANQQAVVNVLTSLTFNAIAMTAPTNCQLVLCPVPFSGTLRAVITEMGGCTSMVDAIVSSGIFGGVTIATNLIGGAAQTNTLNYPVTQGQLIGPKLSGVSAFVSTNQFKMDFRITTP